MIRRTRASPVFLCLCGLGPWIALPCPAEKPEVIRRWTFAAPGDLEGWRVGRGVDDLRIMDGRLHGRLSHEDAYLFAPPLDAPLDGLVIRVRWQCERSGRVQCYFTTSTSPAMGEDKVLQLEAAGGSDVESEFDLSNRAAQRGGDDDRLLGFRLDPFNGQRDVDFSIDEVEVLRLPSRFEVDFSPTPPQVKPGEDVALRAQLRHAGGRRLWGEWTARIEAPTAARLGAAHFAGTYRFFADSQKHLAWTLRFQEPGVHRARLLLSRVDAEREVLTHDIEASVVVGEDRVPADFALEADSAALELVPAAAAGPGFGAARLWARTATGWQSAGLLHPLAEIVWRDEAKDLIVRRHPAFVAAEVSRLETPTAARRLELRATIPIEVASWNSALDLRWVTRAGLPAALRVRAMLGGPSTAEILRFGAPALRRFSRDVDPLDRYALFGGLEFLEPGWRSSSPRAVGPRFAERSCPHPFKISLPVMAIEQSGVTTALLWDPLQSWPEDKSLPAATFASPNSREDDASHVLQLSLPSVPRFLDENNSWARWPIRPDGHGIRIDFLVHLASGEPIARTARLWYEHFGTPPSATPPYDPSSIHGLIAQAYGETLFWPAEKGWRSHWFIEKSSYHRADFAAEILLHARLSGERRWLEATGIDASRALIDTAGRLWDRAIGGESAATAAVSRMREDGTFAYHDSPAAKDATRRHSGGQFDSLGEEGSTSLGTCVQGALPLLRHARWSGDESLLPAARKALDAMRRFRVPRGAQVWEVHQDVPDIRAAALAVEAFRIGFLISGDEACLDDAAYWATAGLPFVFSWRTPHDREPVTVKTSRDRDGGSGQRDFPARELFADERREVNPYGVIPVFGTSFYAVSWFGVLVQWCGLEWAWKVLELTEHRPDPLLEAVARGVTRSGLQQTFDREPWTGLYPDVWNLEGNWAGGALISPHLLVEALHAGGVLHPALKTWSRRAGSGADALLVHGWGEVQELRRDAGRLEVRVRFLAGETGEIVIARAARPKRVLVSGTALAEDSAGWQHDERRKLLGARFRSDSDDVRIEVEW